MRLGLAISTILGLALLGGCGKHPADKNSLAWWQPAAQVDASANLEKVLGPGSRTAWEIEGGASANDGGACGVTDDAYLNKPVLVCGKAPFALQGRTVYRNVEITCQVRLAMTRELNRSSFNLYAARRPGAPKEGEEGIKFTATGARDGNIILSALGERASYNLRAYDTINPAWDDMVRLPLEHDMALLPKAQDKWLTVKLELAPDWTRVWIDGRLLAEKQYANSESSGIIRAEFMPGSLLGGITVKPLTAVPQGFEPVELDGYVRDRALAGGSGLADNDLPRGEPVLVHGIPFRFVPQQDAKSADHLYLGRSLVRQGNMEGYLPANGPRLAGAFTVDPSRIQLRIPNASYDALYVVCAFDHQPDSIPLLTASFYKPGAGFPQFFTGEIPAYDAQGNTVYEAKSATSGAQAEAAASDISTPISLPVKLDNGRDANLWLVKIPLNPSRLASFSNLNALEVELTKEMRQFRSYPDPISYGWHQAGLPSGVHVYAVTLHKPDLVFSTEPGALGHVWTEPAVPFYRFVITNKAAEMRDVTLLVESLSHDGQEALRQESSFRLPRRGEQVAEISLPVTRNGYHEMTATLTCGNLTWTEKRSFARLHADTRAKNWEEGRGPLFGYWSYHGGHETPNGEEIMQVMRMAGARATAHAPVSQSQPAAKHAKFAKLEKTDKADEATDKGDVGKTGQAAATGPEEPESQVAPKEPELEKWFSGPNAWVVRPQWNWAGKAELEPELVDEFQKKTAAEIRKLQGDSPDQVAFFTEPIVSRNATAGIPADYWGEQADYTLDEKRAIHVFIDTAKAAASVVRKNWPNAKILLPWGDPLFIVPLLREGLPQDAFDGVGLDIVGFERLPESQLQQSALHRLYVLREELKKRNMEKASLQFVEGAFVPTEPGACTWDEQADLYHRWSLLSMAYGVNRFYSGWFAYDCANYYGAEHYGGCGIQRRIPYSDPKPAYAAYATMTRLLDDTRFDKWVSTGSHSAYCLRFAKPDKSSIYALWTVRGKRQARLSLAPGAKYSLVDSMDNAQAGLANEGSAAFTISTSPVYLACDGEAFGNVDLGMSDHSDAIASQRHRNQATWHGGPADSTPDQVCEKIICSMGDGDWTVDGPRDAIYENANFDYKRFPGKMSARVAIDGERKGQYLSIHLDQQDQERPFAPWYTILKARKPLVIPGKAAALGMWVKAGSDWGRVVYCLRDAKGERWISTGAKDAWNSNDLHGWNTFNFDGWRYMRFELPSHSEYDCFRELGTTWWGSHGGDGVVDLPLSIESVIVERRTHVVYVNDLQPANPADVLLGDLVAEYAGEFDATPAAVAKSKARMALPQPAATLDNPIKQMEANPLPGIKLERIALPETGYDGTRCQVFFAEADKAELYNIWAAAYPDGRGAIVVGKMKYSGGLVEGIRPGRKLYLWASYSQRLEGSSAPAQSKPSNRLDIELDDAFGAAK